jgi:hypothetical protein
MMSEIMELFRTHGRLTVRELAQHFRMEPAAIEPMLDLLVRKGKILILSDECEKTTCSGCFCADREGMAIYGITDDQKNT